MTERVWTNREVAELLRRIGDILDILGENRYRVMAYRRAADNIEALGQDITDLWREGRLREIPGVGEALAKKLDELLRTGRLGYYERLQAQVPPGVVEMLAIPEVGPKTARLLWQEAGLTTIAEVKAAAEAGELRKLPGLGAKSEANILAGIEALARRKTGRTPLGTAWPLAQELLAGLRAAAPGLIRVEAAGSLRRWRATIGDLDLLVAAEEGGPVMDAFVALPQVAEVLLSGPTKTSVRTHAGLQVDLRVLPPDRWGTGLQYFTGSQAHNIALRELALKRGYSLSEWALKRSDGSELLCADEEAVYETLGLDWIPPELRENRGEIEAAQQEALPDLVELRDIRGDLHVHTDWSDGAATIEEMAEAARARGYEYLLISEHTQGLGVARGLTPERLQAQRAEIERLNGRWSDFRLLHGVEVEIRSDGSLDLPDEVLADLDIVIAAVHSGLRQDRERMTARVISAMRNPHVDILGHPSGRLIGRREESAVDLDEVLKVAAETGTVLEVNAQPSRLDLDDVHIRRAVELGIKLAINSDAHHADGLGVLVYGVATARRGWATAADVVNTRSLDELMRMFEA